MSQAGAAPGAETGLSRDQVRRIVLGLLLAIFLGAVDQTIVSIALVAIASELGELDLVPWIVSGYLVASTVSTPIYGKLSDLYGRRRLLLTAIGIYLVAALLCTIAQSMPQLLLFRILQGLGGGGLLAVSQAAVADVAPGRERGRYQGYFSGVFATAAVAGPVIGGYLTAWLSWRAIFGFSLALGVIAFLISRKTLRLPASQAVRRPIDWLGAALLALGLGALMIGLTRIGQGHGWTSASSLTIAAIAALALVACAIRERVAPEPILPPELFLNRTVISCCVILALNFFVLIGCSVMLPIWMQTLGKATADEVALRMLPLTLAIPAGAFVAGRLLLRFGRFRPIVIGGLAIVAITSFGLRFIEAGSALPSAFAMILLGIGLGLPLPTCLVAVQSAVPARQIGIATALNALFRTLGGAIGISILTSVLFLQVRLYGSLGPGEPIGILSEVPTVALAGGFADVFGLMTIVATLALAIGISLRERSAALS